MRTDNLLRVLICCVLGGCTACPPAQYCSCKSFTFECSLQDFHGSISDLLLMDPDGAPIKTEYVVFFRDVNTTLTMQDTAVMALYFGSVTEKITLHFFGTNLLIAENALENLSKTKLDGLYFQLSHLKITPSQNSNGIPSVREMTFFNVSQIMGLSDLLSKVPNLKSLTLQIANIFGNNYTALSLLHQLEELSLLNTDLAVFPAFSTLPSIKQLGLRSNNMKCVSGDDMSSLPNLKHIDLRNNDMEIFNPSLPLYLHAQLGLNSPYDLNIDLRYNQLRSLDELFLDFRQCSLPSEKQVTVRIAAHSNCICDAPSNVIDNNHQLLLEHTFSFTCNCSAPTPAYQCETSSTSEHTTRSQAPATTEEARVSNLVSGLSVALALLSAFCVASLTACYCYIRRQRQAGSSSTEAAPDKPPSTAERLGLDSVYIHTPLQPQPSHSE